MHSSLQVFYGTTSGASCLDGSASTNPRTYQNRRRIDGFWWQTVLRAETEKQFSACLKVHGHGITIKKLFHLAKQAGISIASNNCQLSFVKRSSAIANSQLKSSPISPISPAEEIEDIEDMPTFSQGIKDTLPSLCANCQPCQIARRCRLASIGFVHSLFRLLTTCLWQLRRSWGVFKSVFVCNRAGFGWQR